jgi:hypothetical protein
MLSSLESLRDQVVTLVKRVENLQAELQMLRDGVPPIDGATSEVAEPTPGAAAPAATIEVERARH